MRTVDDTKLVRFMKRLGCESCSIHMVKELVNGVQIRISRHVYLHGKKYKKPREAGIITWKEKGGQVELTPFARSHIKVVETD